jgi:hypothetical protein
VPDENLWEWTGSRYRYIGGTVFGGRRSTVYVSERMLCQFELNRGGIAKIAVSEPLKAAVHSMVVRDAMPFAIANSPHGRTLEYLSSWRAIDTYEVIAGLRRAACRLFNGSGHAAAVEWVSPRGHGHGYHVLGRTLAHLNSTSPIGLVDAAKRAARAPFNPGLHPRGSGGLFVASNSAAALKRRAAAATRLKKKP